MTEERTYAVRYLHEDWNKPAENPAERITDGIRASSTDYGYADSTFMASILRDDEGAICSILLLSSEGGMNPTREVLEAVRDAIDHQLDEHCP